MSKSPDDVDEEVKMISSEVPLIFAKATEMFIQCMFKKNKKFWK